MEKTPNTKRLCRGPAAFGLTNNPEESTTDANDMYHFFGNYVARSEGVQRISKTLKENKGWICVKNAMTVDWLTYAICSVANHMHSKEQSLGTFAKKCREADCHLTNTEHYSPWMQTAEGCIKVVKRGSSRKMLRTGLPKRLWDYSL